MIEIMNRAEKLTCYANIETANGFFKVIMRRRDDENAEWFWALEWNKSLRIVGAIVQPKNLSMIYENLPQLEWSEWNIQDGMKTRSRKEVRLEPENDKLFKGEVENKRCV